MKKIFLLTCAIALLATTGCHYSDGGGRGHSHPNYATHTQVIIVPATPSHHDRDHD